MTLSLMKLIITIFSIMTLFTKGLYVTLSINDSQLCIMLSVIMLIATARCIPRKEGGIQILAGLAPFSKAEGSF
jgi:hypothetical protein